MITAVLFDLDGTLVNSLFDLAASTNFALTQMGFETHETEEFKYFVGDGMQKLIERALPENERGIDTVKTALGIFMAHYREHFVDKTVAYEGILPLLKALKGYTLAVISNKIEEMAVIVTEKLLGDRFKIICGKRTDFPAKPDPALTLKIIDELGVKPQECVFIGDSGMDMAVAKNAGCVAIGVTWGFRTKDELLENGADYIVNEPMEILEIIENEK